MKLSEFAAANGIGSHQDLQDLFARNLKRGYGPVAIHSCIACEKVLDDTEIMGGCHACYGGVHVDSDPLTVTRKYTPVKKVAILKKFFEGFFNFSKRLENKYLDEERVIHETIIAVRKVQDFLWSAVNDEIPFEEFRRMLRKRLVKMDQITFDNPYWEIEARKRLLQLAAVSINAINKIDQGGFKGSNLLDYSKKTEETQ